MSQSRGRSRGRRDSFPEALIRAMMVQAAESGADNPRAAKPVPEDPTESRPLEVNQVRMLEDAVRFLDNTVSCVAEIREKVGENHPMSVGARREELLDKLETVDLMAAELMESLTDLSTSERRFHSSFSMDLCRGDVSIRRAARSSRAAAKMKADMDALTPDEPEDS